MICMHIYIYMFMHILKRSGAAPGDDPAARRDSAPVEGGQVFITWTIAIIASTNSSSNSNTNNDTNYSTTSITIIIFLLYDIKLVT